MRVSRFMELLQRIRESLKQNRFIYSLVKKVQGINIENFFDSLYLLKNIRKKKYSNEFYNDLLSVATKIGDSKGSSYYKKSILNVAVITDEYMFNYYKDAVNLVYLNQENYEEIITNGDIDLVIFISCWNGIGDNKDWWGDVRRKKVIDVFSLAKRKNIKTIFQTIEDPSNYKVFINIAKHADYIFTSSVEMVDNYKMDTGNCNVYTIDFGINPNIHNPIGFLRKFFSKNNFSQSVFFAGSWAPRYKERCADARTLFDGVLGSSEKELIIADRNSDIKGYNFPAKYANYIIPAIDHEFLQKVHKLFSWTINLNSIKYSASMCAMRIYEIQALGSLLLSNYALSVTNKFPNVFNIFDKKEVEYILNSYSKEEIIDMQLHSIREMFSENTVYDRLNYIFSQIHLDQHFKIKKVYILFEKKTDILLNSYDSQTYSHKELFFMDDFLSSFHKMDLGYFIIFDENVEYEKYFIEDMINSFKFTDVAYVKRCDEVGVDAYDYVKNNNTKKSTLYDMEKVSISQIISSEEIDLDGFSIVQPKIVGRVTDSRKELGVIVPSYNNGRFLRDRCFRSLLRSSVFNKMEIYIVDDGSEKETIEIIKELEERYDNVTSFFFNDDGSGSASRPRNKGVQICTEKYITFLDPDNEAINDGYSILLNDLKAHHVDMAFGCIYKVSDKAIRLSFKNSDELIKNPKNELLASNFKAQSIQGCIIKRELIINNNITNPIGALGQDTLFFYELMLNANSAYYRNLPIHLYYAQRENSVINTIGKKFFEKFLILEKYQVQKLKANNVLEQYKEQKLNNFIELWYKEKLNLVPAKEKEECIRLIDEIKKQYFL